MNARYLPFVYGAIAILGGVVVNVVGDRITGVRLEHFWGISTFSLMWILDLFLVPFIAGFAVAFIYGLGGKLLCYFVPLLVRGASYLEMVYISGTPEGAIGLPIYYWILIVIVAIESAAFGGVAGEILVKRTYGRRPRHMVYKQKSN